jgi:hypothetical protein
MNATRLTAPRSTPFTSSRIATPQPSSPTVIE